MTCKLAGEGWSGHIDHSERKESYTCDFLHGDGPKYTASTSVGAIIVGRFERKRFTAEDGVKETTRFSGLCNGLTNRKGLGMFL